MGWGVLEDPRSPRAPGTVLLDDIGKLPDADSPETANLKRDGHIILQPQPSDSVNDPLNWSPKRKTGIIFLLIVSLVTIGGTSAMLGTGGRKLAEQYHVDYPAVVRALSPPSIATNAVALFLASAIAAVYGKRVQMVVAIVALWFTMLAGYFANSLGYYTGLQVSGGLFHAPFELLLAPLITDMIYVHQRGRLMALSAIVGVAGGDASHVIAGNIVAKLGIKYTYIVSFGVLVPLVVLIYFFAWETTFPRPIVQQNTSDSFATAADVELKKPQVTMIERVETEQWSGIGPDRTRDYAADRKLTFREQLVVFRGRVTDRNFFKAFMQPFPLMVFPSVLFSTIINGAFMTWMIVSGIISHQVLLYPPYNLKPDVLAYVGLPGSVVGLLSAVGAGLLSDWVIRFMAHRNNGVYEPEFRLVLMAPAILFSTIGFLSMGPAYAEHAKVVRLIGNGLVFHIAGPFANSACITYIFDTMQNTSTEAMVATSLFKHIFAFFATTYVPGWFKHVGPIKCFRTLAILNICFSVMTIPMYVYGKRMRGMIGRNEFLTKHSLVR
ncbi:MFS general substrate transporter [Trichodelitschia bisporula]|uniref:MFS general substrate transporter n=1 Tax=Trichodelitschia bisporula TaxID=703511 RepID=A0A6G1HN35_9PEZI|nr:MFS general substrate transporter [Trichodelitschia bisporula]